MRNTVSRCDMKKNRTVREHLASALPASLRKRYVMQPRKKLVRVKTRGVWGCALLQSLARMGPKIERQMLRGECEVGILRCNTNSRLLGRSYAFTTAYFSLYRAVCASLSDEIANAAFLPAGHYAPRNHRLDCLGFSRFGKVTVAIDSSASVNFAL